VEIQEAAMFGRGMVAAGVLGGVVVHHLSDLPSASVLLAGTAGILLVGLLAWRMRGFGHVVWIRRLVVPILVAGWAGFCLTALWAHHRLEQVLAEQNVDRVTRVELRVESLPKLLPDRVSFEALVLQAHPPGVPASAPPAGGRASAGAATMRRSPMPQTRPAW
jgi:competence protein ComEC